MLSFGDWLAWFPIPRIPSEMDDYSGIWRYAQNCRLWTLMTNQALVEFIDVPWSSHLPWAPFVPHTSFASFLGTKYEAPQVCMQLAPLGQIYWRGGYYMFVACVWVVSKPLIVDMSPKFDRLATCWVLSPKAVWGLDICQFEFKKVVFKVQYWEFHQ